MSNSIDWNNPQNYNELPSMQQSQAFNTLLSDAYRKARVGKGLVKGLPKNLYKNTLGPLGIKTSML